MAFGATILLLSTDGLFVTVPGLDGGGDSTMTFPEEDVVGGLAAEVFSSSSSRRLVVLRFSEFSISFGAVVVGILVREVFIRSFIPGW